MFFSRGTKAELAKLKSNVAAQQKSLLASLLASAWVVEARDPYTGGHLWRVAMLSGKLARALGLSESEANRIAMAGFLHDLGKIGVPDAILRKPDKLTDDEFAVIKTHPNIGARLIASHPFSPLVMNAVLGHHETPNGRGYPQGLSDAQIALDAKIVGVCDAFDAMTSSRPYRRGMPIEKALQIIASELGQQFDRRCGEALIALQGTGELEHIVGHSDEGIPLAQCLMCGPTLVQVRGSHAGGHLACPNCTADYVWESDAAGHLAAKPTGNKASADALAPVADVVQIEDLATRWVSALEVLQAP
ncbi:HD-GYP domain-containing protein [Chitinibacter sp. SCUT-21]|uniref:HD-GYP domain-containing protein n=1 Tax=Chitinibacter sp. SCUT-21 TaxID=2970891 RepID=UPI0035A717FC